MSQKGQMFRVDGALSVRDPIGLSQVDPRIE
jgi:hypothetical protein